MVKKVRMYIIANYLNFCCVIANGHFTVPERKLVSMLLLKNNSENTTHVVKVPEDMIVRKRQRLLLA